ncbi:MAG: ABC transporter permease [Clostridia bacterium]|nr:ABC transporter permease [Clostridia bacterium]
MRTINFAKRNFKEIIRDPLSIVFAIALPLFLLFIFQQIKIPNEAYNIENFTPGIVVFSFSFITLFTAMLVAKDRTSSLLIRLSVSPMKAVEYILGYIISIIPIILLQNVLFYILAIILGLKFTISVVFAIFVSILVSIIFIALGILIGSIFSEKASSGISSIVVQFVCFTSGMYFSADMLGETFAKVCKYLPFEPAVNIIKAVMNNNYEFVTLENVIVFIIYTIISLVLSSIMFKKKMTSDNK